MNLFFSRNCNYNMVQNWGPTEAEKSQNLARAYLLNGFISYTQADTFFNEIKAVCKSTAVALRYAFTSNTLPYFNVNLAIVTVKYQYNYLRHKYMVLGLMIICCQWWLRVMDKKVNTLPWCMIRV